jgi:hypothetical protein
LKIASAKVHHSLKEAMQMLNNDSERREEEINNKEEAQDILNNELAPDLVFAALKFIYKDSTGLPDELLNKDIIATIKNARDWWLIIKEHWCNIGSEKQYRKDYLINFSQYMQANIFCLPFQDKKDINEIMEALKSAELDIVLSGFELSNHTREYTKSDEFIQSWIKHIKKMQWQRKKRIADILQPLGILFPHTITSKTFLIFEKCPFYLMKKLTGLLGFNWDKSKFKRRTGESLHRLTTEIIFPKHKPKNPGVYRITCIPTGEFYIGSSDDMDSRIQEHLDHLKCSRHWNLHFQRLWREYGDPNQGLNGGNFNWKIEDNEIQDYRAREEELIEQLKPEINGNFKKNLKIPANLWERICSVSGESNKDSRETEKKINFFALQLLEEKIEELELKYSARNEND